MDHNADLPPRLRPPAGGDSVRLTWLADLGSQQRPADLGSHLQDLDVAVCLGERWGAALASASALQANLYRLSR